MRMYENQNIHTKTGFDQLDLDATGLAPKVIEWHVIMIIRARRKLLASGRTDQYQKAVEDYDRAHRRSIISQSRPMKDKPVCREALRLLHMPIQRGYH